MSFSGALTLTDLNDFITPSQVCIKPVEEVNKPEEREKGAAETEIQIDSSGGYYEVSASATAGTNSIPVNGDKKGKKLVQAEVSLSDCLACSGCITSAESVLITLQSHTEVLNFLQENSARLPPSQRHTTVVSIAPQPLASIAASLSERLSSGGIARDEHAGGSGGTIENAEGVTVVTPRQILHRVRAFLTSVLGVDHVFDTTFARHVALREHVLEFLERRSKAQAQAPRDHHPGGGPNEEQQHQQLPVQLPMLASACPGWVCYAEKAHPEMLPFIARTKSPQQMMGSLVKEWMGMRWERKPNEIYHVTVMPCYDKKLEASRSDFYNDLYSTRDVDCVITTGELEKMMQEQGWDITKAVEGEEDEPRLPSVETLLASALNPVLGGGGVPASSSKTSAAGDQKSGCGNCSHRKDEGGHHASGKTCSGASPSSSSSSPTTIPGTEAAEAATATATPNHAIWLPELLTHRGTSSGSYLHAILNYLTLTSPVPLELSVKMIRNADYEEYILTQQPTNGSAVGKGKGKGKVVFKGAKCYGFRNLQNVVRKVGRESGVRVGVGAAGRLASGGVNGVNGGGGGGGGIRARVAARKKKAVSAGGDESSAAIVVVDDERGREGYDYVEVMACPGGCVNGGGQLKPPMKVSAPEAAEAPDRDEEGYERKGDWVRRVANGEGVIPETEEVTMAEGVLQNAKWGDKEWTKRVEKVYWSGMKSTRTTEEEDLAERLACMVTEEVSRGSEVKEGIDKDKFLRTQYRAVENEVIGLAVKW